MKQDAHAILEYILHQIATTGKGHKSIITVPYYKLIQEVAFREKAPDLNVRLTIKAEFVDDDGDVYESAESASENKTSN